MKQVTFGGWFNAVSVSTPQYGRNGGVNWSAFVGDSIVGKVPVRTGQWIFMAVAYNQATLPGTFAFYMHDAAGLHVIRGADKFDTNSVTTGVDQSELRSTL